MNRLQALLNERAALLAEDKGIFERAEREARDLTEDEKARDDAIHERLQRLDAEVERQRRADIALSVAHGVLSPSNTGRPPEEDFGFNSLADFSLAVRQACRPGGYVDDRLQFGAAPTNFHRESGADEGYMVPPAFRQDIWQLVFAADDVLALVNPEPTSSNSVEMLTDESTPWGASGVTAYWRSEGAQMSATKLATKAVQVKLHELYAFVLASEELLADAPRLNARLTKAAADAIRWKASEAIMLGTGAGQPLGWMKAGCLVSVAKEAAQAADTIVAANVAKMFSRVLNPGRAVWLANQDTIPQLLTMTLGQQPIWTPPASGFQNAPGGYLFGRPIQLSEHCATLGDQGDLQLVNPDGYYAVVRESGPAFASSIHLFFDYGVQAFRWTFRLGGQPFLSAAVSPAKGASTKSHFVVLDARA